MQCKLLNAVTSTNGNLNRIIAKMVSLVNQLIQLQTMYKTE